MRELTDRPRDAASLSSFSFTSGSTLTDTSLDLGSFSSISVVISSFLTSRVFMTLHSILENSLTRKSDLV